MGQDENTIISEDNYSSSSSYEYSQDVVVIKSSLGNFGGVLICPETTFLSGVCASRTSPACVISPEAHAAYQAYCVPYSHVNHQPPKALNVDRLALHLGQPDEWLECGDRACLGLCASGEESACMARSTNGSEFGFSHGVVYTDDINDPLTMKLDLDECEEISGTDVMACDFGFGVAAICAGVDCLNPNHNNSDSNSSDMSAAVAAVRCCEIVQNSSVMKSDDDIITFAMLGGIALFLVALLLLLRCFRGRCSGDGGDEAGPLVTFSRYGGSTRRIHDSMKRALSSVPKSRPYWNKIFKENSSTINLTEHGLGFHINPNLLEIGPLISRGGEGFVFRGKYAGSPVAIKEFFNHNGFKSMDSYSSLSSSTRANVHVVPRPHPSSLHDGIKSEFDCLCMIQHPNIVRAFGLCCKVSRDSGLVRHLLVMELAKCNLRQVMDTSTSIPLLRLLDLARQTCIAGAFMHAAGLIHMDLKPENLLLDHSDTIKVCDLGLAHLSTSRSSVGNKGQFTLKDLGVNGTPSYMAPERIRDFKQSLEEDQGVHITSAVDVYAFGIILWELYHLTRPFPIQWDGFKIVASVKIRDCRPVIVASCPPDLGTIIRQCWVRDPNDRPTFPEILLVLEKMISHEEMVRRQLRKRSSTQTTSSIRKSIKFRLQSLRRPQSTRSNRSGRSGGTTPGASPWPATQHRLTRASSSTTRVNTIALQHSKSMSLSSWSMVDQF